MNRIDKLFKTLKKKKEKAFIAYITAGDPSLKLTEKIVLALEKEGVDLVELGIPFSDPLADGKENQAAASRALKKEINIKKILSAVQNIRKKSDLPLIFFTYFNPVFKYGLKKFIEDAKKAGLDGTLILDLPPEESLLYQKLGKNHNLKTIYLITPNTPLKRIKLITALSSGFIYYVSRTGVTGMRDSLEKNTAQKVKIIKKYTKLPVVVGFGISNKKQARLMAALSEGVVVGSAIVAQIRENLRSSRLLSKVGALVKELVSGVKK